MKLPCARLPKRCPLFAPEVEVLTLPGWDCLPYDRASPALRVMAERFATLNALQSKREKPQLLVSTATGATQRVLTPFRIRQLTRRIAEGERIEREALVEQLNSLGYQRSDTVAEHGEYAVRGSLIDVFPAGAEQAFRLDFFGDEIDSLRRFDPSDQRSTDKADGVNADASVRGLAGRRQHQALPLALPGKIRSHLDAGSAVSGGIRRPAHGRHGALAAATRGTTGDARSIT